MSKYNEDNLSFLIYKDWELLFDSLESDDQAGQLIKALFAFAKRGEVPELSGALKMAFLMMSQQIERDGHKWEKRVEKLKANGAKGGRPKKEENQEKPNGFEENQMVIEKTNCNQTKAKEPVTVTVTDTVTVKDTVTVTDINRVDAPHQQKKPVSKFVKPTVEEVAEYCKLRNNSVDAEAFYDFYESKGWKIGKNTMKDWKAAVRTWERSESKRKDEQLPRGWSKAYVPTEEDFASGEFI